MTYFNLEQYDMALKYQEHTIQLLESMNKAYNLDIAYTIKGFCLIELSRFKEGLADFKKALNYSGLSHYANGLVEIPLYMTYGKVRNHLKVSLEYFKRQVKAYDVLDPKDPYGYYLITYIFKHLGDEKSYNFWYKTAKTHISDNLYVIRKIESI